MNPNALHAALPDLSARIMHHTVTTRLNVSWDAFCVNSRIKPMRLDEGSRELLAQDEMLLQQGFAHVTSNHPDLWFDVGLRYRSLKYGTLGLAMMTAGTLAQALEVACRYQALTYSLIDYRYVSAPNGSCALLGDTGGIPADLHDFTQHRDLGAIKTLIDDLTAGEPVLERITVSAPPPGNWEAIRRSFCCPVEFYADRTAWIFRPGAAGRPLPLGDQSLLAMYSSRCDELLDHARSAVPVAQRLTALLNARGEDLLSAADAARQLALSERTLHRRLAEEGTRYSAIVDEARFRRARDLLADRRMSIEAVAFAVGFSEPSSLSRAFKRWSGMGAFEYRRQHLPAKRG
ncbi:AraC family transcriptional regulator ligand-binding domain-containing protein [Novosphingobium colocasiae]|uniref:AraC family transcriptional regulator n=1 Tax=Novosphingobium colocasiae TaxID=1256513 RepID=UPI0035AD95AB